MFSFENTIHFLFFYFILFFSFSIFYIYFISGPTGRVGPSVGDEAGGESYLDIVAGRSVSFLFLLSFLIS